MNPIAVMLISSIIRAIVAAILKKRASLPGAVADHLDAVASTLDAPQVDGEPESINLDWIIDTITSAAVLDAVENLWPAFSKLRPFVSLAVGLLKGILAKQDTTPPVATV